MPRPASSYRPDAMNAVTPYLICKDAAKAIDFYVKAFGAVEQGRIPDPQGRIINAMISIEGGSIMLMDEMPEMGANGPQTLGGSPVSIHVFVPDVDAFAAHAVKNGATLTMPVSDQFWGDRFCMMTDPFGHAWSFGTHKWEMTPQEMADAARTAFEQAQGAEGAGAR